MRSKSTAPRLLAVMVGILALAAPLHAFSGKDHKRLTEQGIKNLPPAYKELLKEHAEYMKHESPAPDFFRRKSERMNHVWHPKGDWGNNVKKVVSLSAELVKLLRPVMTGETKKVSKSVARKLAHLCHYVQDLCQPLHTSQSDKDETKYHMAFEKLWETEDLKKVLTWKGPARPVADILAWHKANGKWANKFYKEIGADYADDKKFNKPRTFQIYKLTFSRAHKATVEILTTVFHLASQKPKKKKDPGK